MFSGTAVEAHHDYQKAKKSRHAAKKPLQSCSWHESSKGVSFLCHGVKTVDGIWKGNNVEGKEMKMMMKGNVV
eukprot:scaffold4140_cov81-Cylindrotheca_fusiformis.AAC.5